MSVKLLDLFSCAGGAARGYQNAGFHVTGVDINPQPNDGIIIHAANRRNRTREAHWQGPQEFPQVHLDGMFGLRDATVGHAQKVSSIKPPMPSLRRETSCRNPSGFLAARGSAQPMEGWPTGHQTWLRDCENRSARPTFVHVGQKWDGLRASTSGCAESGPAPGAVRRSASPQRQQAGQSSIQPRNAQQVGARGETPLGHDELIETDRRIGVAVVGGQQ